MGNYVYIEATDDRTINWRVAQIKRQSMVYFISFCFRDHLLFKLRTENIEFHLVNTNKNIHS